MFASIMNKVKKNLEWYDISALKISVLFFALWLAKVVPQVLKLGTSIYFVVWVALMAYLLLKLFK